MFPSLRSMEIQHSFCVPCVCTLKTHHEQQCVLVCQGLKESKHLFNLVKTVTAHNDNTLACRQIENDVGKKLENKAHVCHSANRPESATFENLFYFLLLLQAVVTFLYLFGGAYFLQYSYIFGSKLNDGLGFLPSLIEASFLIT